MPQYRVKGRDRWDPKRLNEVERVTSVVPAPDPVLVLHGNDIDAVAYRARNDRVLELAFATNPMVDLGRVGLVVHRGCVKGHDLAAPGSNRQIGRERRDATAP